MRRREHDDRTVADVLRGFQLLEARHSLDRSRCLSSALLVKNCAYNPAVNALQEKCGNHRLRNHDVALSQQLQNGNVVGGVRWTDADSEWLEDGTVYDDSDEQEQDEQGWADTQLYFDHEEEESARLGGPTC